MIAGRYRSTDHELFSVSHQYHNCGQYTTWQKGGLQCGGYFVWPLGSEVCTYTEAEKMAWSCLGPSLTANHFFGPCIARRSIQSQHSICGKAIFCSLFLFPPQRELHESANFMLFLVGIALTKEEYRASQCERSS